MAFLLIVDPHVERSSSLLRRLRSFGHEGIVLSERSARWTLDRGLRPDAIVVQADVEGVMPGFQDGHAGSTVLLNNSSDPDAVLHKVLQLVSGKRPASVSGAAV